MTRMRRAFALLLSAALLIPQGVRADASACAGDRTLAAAPAATHSSSDSQQSCRQHHPGNDSMPAGMNHCAASLNCVSNAALPVSAPESNGPATVATQRAAPAHCPPSAILGPQAPPPRV